MASKFWLMKAEPESRIVKGKEVKFSVEDFQRVGQTAWEGVRNHEAKNLMKEMKIGDKVLFYHSNCKNPGVAGLAEVCKEAYPDYTAWDSEHPYYDPKTDKEKPRWFMVDLQFTVPTKHLVPLSLLKHVSATSAANLPEGIKYIGEAGVAAISGMALVNRGRLSVQRVNEDAWNTVLQLGENGGWEEPVEGGRKKRARTEQREAEEAGDGDKEIEAEKKPARRSKHTKK